MIRWIISFLVLFSFSYGATLEERIEALEKKVKQLEEEIKQLKGETVEKKKTVQKTVKIVTNNPEKLVLYRPLKKWFKKLSIKESLWNKSDKIIIKMQFKNNTGKEVDYIKGKVVVYDKAGNPLMETKINLNKGLNFFKGTTIKPEEELTTDVEFEYSGKNPKHRFVKDTPLKDLKVRFFPTEIHYSDGTTEFIKR